MYLHNKGEFWLVITQGIEKLEEKCRFQNARLSLMSLLDSKLRQCKVPFKKTSCVTLNYNSCLFHLQVFAIQVVSPHL